MADEILTAMVAPQAAVTYCTRDGTPYRASAVDGLVYARPEHIAELTGYGFAAATASQVPPGATVTLDEAW